MTKLANFVNNSVAGRKLSEEQERGSEKAPLVTIPCTKALRAMLDGMERQSAAS